MSGDAKEVEWSQYPYGLTGDLIRDIPEEHRNMVETAREYCKDLERRVDRLYRKDKKTLSQWEYVIEVLDDLDRDSVEITEELYRYAKERIDSIKGQLK